MEVAITIQDEVERFLYSDITISKFLSEGLFNINALSEKLVKENLPHSSVIAVSSAIRRYQEKHKGNNISHIEDIYGILRNGKITTRDDVVKIIVEKSENTHSLIAAFGSKVKSIHGHLFRFTEGIEQALVVIDRGNMELFDKTFGHEKVVRNVPHLGQITIALPKETLIVSGVYATLLRELFSNGINIEEAHTCENNYLILVAETDMLRSYHQLTNLFARARKHFEEKVNVKPKKLQKAVFDENLA